MSLEANDMGKDITILKGGDVKPVTAASDILDTLISERDRLTRKIEALQSEQGRAAKFIDGWLIDSRRTFDPIELAQFLFDWEVFKASKA